MLDAHARRRLGIVPMVALAAAALVVPISGAAHAATASNTYTWGDNSYGELGNGTTGGYSTEPGPVSDAITVTDADAGEDHACAVADTGSAYCWGANGFGQLGTGTLTQADTATRVAGDHTFTQISTGDVSSCAVTTTGAAYCWGYNGFGGLGDGTTNNASSPVAVAGSLEFTQVSAGRYHACGVTTSGSAYCWGLNNYGQLGDGTTTGSTSPVAVTGGRTFRSISSGTDFTCAVTTDNDAYCWGLNGSGQLGDGTTTSSPTPTSIPSISFLVISAGAQHTCGVTTGAAAYCWGLNSSGQLGDGTTTDRTSPQAVDTASTYRTISAGQNHTCAVTTTDAAECWGSNSAGQLGDGTTVSTTSAVPVIGGYSFTSVAAGHSTSVAIETPESPTAAAGAPGRWPVFTFQRPDGGECSGISPQYPAVNTWFSLPDADAPCSEPDATVTGWSIPGQESAFAPGRRVWVVDSQVFTSVLEYAWVTVEYDANVGAEDPCLSDGRDLPVDERTGVTHIPREIITDQPLWSAPVCVPPGHRFAGWRIGPETTAPVLSLGEGRVPAPQVNSDGDAANVVHLWATWEPGEP